MLSCPSRAKLRDLIISAGGLLVRAALTSLFTVAHVSAQDPNSVEVSLSNQSKADLIIGSTHLETSDWVQGPTPLIKGMNAGGWKAQAKTIATGLSGEVNYYLHGCIADHLTLRWNNPRIGTNSYSWYVPTGYILTREGGDGDQARVTFFLTEADAINAATPPVSVEAEPATTRLIKLTWSGGRGWGSEIVVSGPNLDGQTFPVPYTNRGCTHPWEAFIGEYPAGATPPSAVGIPVSLSPGSPYNFSVCYHNNRKPDVRICRSAEPFSYDLLPKAPSNVTVVIQKDGIHIAWSSNDRYTTGFVAKQITGKDSRVAHAAVVNGQQTTWSFVDQAPPRADGSYTYEVCAFDNGKYSWDPSYSACAHPVTASAHMTTAHTPAIPVINVSDLGAAGFIVIWPSNDSNTSSYQIKRSTAGGSWATVSRFPISPEPNGGKNMWVDHGPFVAAMRYAYEVCANNTLTDITATPVCSKPVTVLRQSNVARSPLSGKLPSDSAPGPRGSGVVGKEMQPQTHDSCKPGFVWRETQSSDHVCVTPQTRARTLNENQTASQHKLPNSDACKQGYVWRQVVPTDHVCVTPQSRAVANEDNRYAAERRAN